MARHLFLCLALLFAGSLVRAEPVSVFAAASLKTALEEIASDWSARSGSEVTLTFAASSTLARQVDQGAPADLVFLANTDWMDWLVDRGAVSRESRKTLLGNSLVLIGPTGADPLPPVPGFPLAARLGEGPLAMALVTAVPVGIYGRAALESLGVWDAVVDRVAQTDNARTTLALVARGEAPLGIVYGSDALAEPRVEVLGRFPSDAHPEIAYPAALTLDAGPAAAAFLAHLQAAEAAASFRAHGFVPHD